MGCVSKKLRKILYRENSSTPALLTPCLLLTAAFSLKWHDASCWSGLQPNFGCILTMAFQCRSYLFVDPIFFEALLHIPSMDTDEDFRCFISVDLVVKVAYWYALCQFKNDNKSKDHFLIDASISLQTPYCMHPFRGAHIWVQMKTSATLLWSVLLKG